MELFDPPRPCITATVVLASLGAMAQSPVNCYRFETTITRGENAYNNGFCLFQDSSYYCFYQPDTSLATEVSVIDKVGNVLFKRRIERAVPDMGFAYQPKQILRNSDSTVLLLTNYQWSPDIMTTLYAVQVTCLNAQGDVIWHREYSDPALNVRGDRMVIDTNDGAILISGITYTFVPQNLYLLKLDAEGSLQWAKRYASEAYLLMSMVGDDAHSLYLGYHNEAHDLGVLKLDINGIPIWSRKLIAPYVTTNYSAAYSPFTDRVAFSCLHNHTTSLVYDTIDPMIVELDTNGLVTFAKHYHSSYHKSAVSIAATPDTGWVATLTSNHPAHVNGGLMKVNDLGDPEWGHMYATGTQCNYWSDALLLTPDDAFAHTLDLWQNPVRRFLLLKSDRYGHTSCPGEAPLLFETHSLEFEVTHSAISVIVDPWTLIASQPEMISTPVVLPDAIPCADTVVYDGDISTNTPEPAQANGIRIGHAPGSPVHIQLPAAGVAMLFAPDGRLTRTFRLSAGEHWMDLQDHAYGVYLLRVCSGQQQLVRRVVP